MYKNMNESEYEQRAWAFIVCNVSSQSIRGANQTLATRKNIFEEMKTNDEILHADGKHGKKNWKRKNERQKRK